MNKIWSHDKGKSKKDHQQENKTTKNIESHDYKKHQMIKLKPKLTVALLPRYPLKNQFEIM